MSARLNDRDPQEIPVGAVLAEVPGERLFRTKEQTTAVAIGGPERGTGFRRRREAD